MYNDIQEISEKAIKSYFGKRPKITFTEEDYQVDKKKGTVHCFLRCKMPNTLFNDREFRTFVGTARVCGNDPFDEELGKKIARTKAELKAYKAYERQFVKLVQSISKYIRIIDRERWKAHLNYLNSVCYLDNYCKEEE